MIRKTTHSHAVTTALACGVLYFAYDLSRSGRTVIDWVVMGLVCAAILWNVLKLGHRLASAGGVRSLWHLAGALSLWVVGLLLVTHVVGGGSGSWQQALGIVLLAGAVGSSVVVYRIERSAQEPGGGPAEPAADQ